VLPLHPRTKKHIAELGLRLSEHIRIVEPVSYLQMVALEVNAKVILTDSGGVQKEAYIFTVPCVTLRDETEWVETVESGWNILTGADSRRIIEAAGRADSPPRADWKSFYGDGRAAEKICEIISRKASNRPEGSRR
jgi:UDP-N-acetylglucosamine 2-epimerase